MPYNFSIVSESNIRSLALTLPFELDERLNSLQLLDLLKCAIHCESYRAIAPSPTHPNILRSALLDTLYSPISRSGNGRLKDRFIPVADLTIASPSLIKWALEDSGTYNLLSECEPLIFKMKAVAHHFRGTEPSRISDMSRMDIAITVARAFVVKANSLSSRNIKSMLDRYRTHLNLPTEYTFQFQRDYAAGLDALRGLGIAPLRTAPREEPEDATVSIRNRLFDDEVEPAREEVVNSNPSFITDQDDQVIYLSTSEKGVVTRESRHDLTVKYSDCFGLYEDKGIYVRDFVQKRGMIFVKFDYISDQYLTDNYQQIVYSPLFTFVPPILGAINYENYVLYVERVHRKPSPGRYRKALRRDLLEITSVYAGSLSAVNISNDIIYTDSVNSLKWLMNDILLPTHFTYEEAISLVLSFGRIAAAFSSDYHIGYNFLSNNIVMYKGIKPIGTYDLQSSTWIMSIDSFNSELIEMGVPLCIEQ